MRNFRAGRRWTRPSRHTARREEEREVGEPARVVLEVVDLAVDEELLEDHVPHGHRQRAVGARGRRQPLVGELDVVGVVRRHRDDLLSAVAGLGHPVGVRGPGHGDVGAPHHEVAGIPPVAGLGHVGLVAPDLRRGDRQVGVPVVEGQHGAADERGEPRARRVADHRHRGNGEKPATRSGPHCLIVWTLAAATISPPRPTRPAPGRPCHARTCSAWPSRDRPRRRPRRAPGRRAAAWPRGTSRAGHRARTGSGSGWGSTCTGERGTARTAAGLVLWPVGSRGG